MTLPVLDLSGTPYDQGVQHGRELSDRIVHNLDVYADCFAREGVSFAEVRSRAAGFLEAMVEHNADYVDTMRGIASGAGVELVDIVTLNVRYEILYYQFGINARTDGCTAFAVGAERSADHHSLLGQNWDWIPDVQGAVLRSTRPDGLRTLSFTEAGIVGGKIGLNSAGLGLTINGLTTTADDWSRFGKPFHLRCYEILQSRDLERAVAIASEGVWACSANFLIASARDGIADVEASPQGIQVHPPYDGLLVHTNHFFDPAVLGVVETESDRRDRSCFRQERLDQLLASTRPLAISDLQWFLRDHEHYPYSVCYHVAPDAAPDERYATVTSVVMDLTAGTLDITDGLPCENPYQRVPLTPSAVV